MLPTHQPKYWHFATEPLWQVLLAFQSCLSNIWSHLNLLTIQINFFGFFYINITHIILSSSGGLLITNISSSFWGTSFHRSILNRILSASYLIALTLLYPNAQDLNDWSSYFFFFFLLPILGPLVFISLMFPVIWGPVPHIALAQNSLFFFFFIQFYILGTFVLFMSISTFVTFFFEFCVPQCNLPSHTCITPSPPDLTLPATFVCLIKLSYVMSVVVLCFHLSLHQFSFCIALHTPKKVHHICLLKSGWYNKVSGIQYTYKWASISNRKNSTELQITSGLCYITRQHNIDLSEMIMAVHSNSSYLSEPKYKAKWGDII